MREKIKKYGVQFTLSKYIFTFSIVILAYFTHKSLRLLVINCLELGIIFILTELFVGYRRWLNCLTYFLNFLFLSIIIIQNFVLYFGDSYVTLVMVTNLESMGALSGKLIPIIFALLSYTLFMCLPIYKLNLFNNKGVSILSCLLLSELVATLLVGNVYSPLYAVYKLGNDFRDYQIKLDSIREQPNVTQYFYHENLKQLRNKDSNLTHQPNIVLIFVEGLSENIIDDDRSIMPNMRDLQSNSMNFKNYFNHTMATYRGIIGQLYSGYQLDDHAHNTLVSLQSVLKENGYHTSFINSEPANTQFTTYLTSLGFDDVINDLSKNSGVNNTLSDEESFDSLFNTIEKQANNDQPFFTSIYTFGTHTSLDSVNKKFGDESNPLLNRFYNFDYYLGQFIDKFNASDLADDTIVVITSDHATYADNDYKSAFPDYVRNNPHVDRIPLFIYYKGMTPEEIDVQGRNSLDLTPTILDYLDINTPNYFLGETLFETKNNNNSFDTIFYDTNYLLTTDLGVISSISSENEQTINELLEKYFAAHTQEPLTP